MRVGDDDGGFDVPSDWDVPPLAQWAQSESELESQFGIDWESQLRACRDFVLAGYALRKQLKFRAAQAMFEKAIELEPGNLQALEGYIEIVRTQGYRDAVIKILKTWSESYADRADVQLFIGKVYRKLWLNNEALAAFNRCLCLTPDSIEAQYCAGLQLERSLKFREAALAFFTIIEKEPNHVSAWFHLARCCFRVDEDLNQTEIALQHAERLGRKDWPMTILYCEVLLYKGQVDQATQRFQTYLSENGEKLYYYHSFANRLLDFGFEEESLQYFEKSSGGFRAMGGALEDMGRHDAATEQFKLIVQANLPKPKAWLDLAKFLARHGQTEQAICACQEALALDEETPQGRRLLAELLYAQGEIQESERQYAWLLKRFPQDTQAGAALGYLALDMGKLDEARRFLKVDSRRIDDNVPRLRASFNRSKDNADIAFALGEVFLARGFPYAAMDYLQKAVKLSPIDSRINLAVGNTYLAFSPPLVRLAATYFQKALDVNENLSDAHRGLVHCYRAMHRYPELRRHESRAREIDPHIDLTDKHWWLSRD